MTKTQINIGNDRLDLFDNEEISVKSVGKDSKDFTKIQSDFSKSFNVPATKRNNIIFTYWFNADIDGGFDGRTLKEGFILLDTLTFKKGKIRLENVKIKNKQIESYNITFFGETINIKDKIRNDKLKSLDWLSNFDHDYSDSLVKTYLQQGLDVVVSSELYEKAIIYPLISYNRQYFINTDPSVLTSGDTSKLVNIDHNPSRTDGVFFKDLKPAISLYLIIEAIQIKYGFNFTGTFFDSTRFKKIYMNLNNETEEIKQGFLEFYNNTVFIPPKPPKQNGIISYRVVIVPTAGFENTNYKVQLFIDGVLYYSDNDFVTGSTTSGPVFYTGVRNKNINFTASVITEGDFSFQANARITGNGFSAIDDNINNQSVFNGVVIKNQLPDIKVIDFLTSIFKTFNLVAVTDNENIIIEDLQTWYAKGQIYDVTRYIDQKTETVKRPKIFSEVNFKFKESKQILADEYKQSFDIGYGDFDFRLEDGEGNDIANLDADKLEVESIFEQPIFERLTDQVANGVLSNVIYCPYFNREIKPISDNPFLFYVIEQNVSLGFKEAINYSEINTVLMPSHSLELQNSFNLNFGGVINEYTSERYEDTIYNRYYNDFISDIFSIKRRDYNYEAILPIDLINKIKMNDRLVINGRRYLINSISSNLNTRKDVLELSNDIYDAPLSSDLLSNSIFNPTSAIHNASAISDSTIYVGVSGADTQKVDLGDGDSWLDVDPKTTKSTVESINYTLEANTTGLTRVVGIQVLDSINDPVFNITQLSDNSLDFSGAGNSQYLGTIINNIKQ